METTAKHTPTPWKATHIGEGEYRKEIVIDVATCGQIAEVLDAGNGQANAAYIVRAVNSHADLLEALKAVEVDCMDRGDSLLWTALGGKIRAAIAKATGNE
jgi:hypothetical protein